jgi:hypothetical protein
MGRNGTVMSSFTKSMYRFLYEELQEHENSFCNKMITALTMIMMKNIISGHFLAVDRCQNSASNLRFIHFNISFTFHTSTFDFSIIQPFTILPTAGGSDGNSRSRR